jgi:predicted transcriptional regulator
MMNTGMLGTKNVETCGVRMSILQVAEQMRSEHVGDLVVIEYHQGEPIPVGIITDRDLVIEVMAMRVDPASVTVGDVMSRKLILARDNEDLEVSLERMRNAGIRRVPLVNTDGVLVGIVTLDDVVEKLASTLSDVSRIGKQQGLQERVIRR